MPKRVFWPAALIVMGLIFLASNMGYLPAEFWNLWPLILIVVGLGGLLTSDQEEWTSAVKPSRKRVVKKSTKKTTSRKRKVSRKK
jgi:hypothetical protein